MDTDTDTAHRHEWFLTGRTEHNGTQLLIDTCSRCGESKSRLDRSWVRSGSDWTPAAAAPGGTSSWVSAGSAGLSASF